MQHNNVNKSDFRSIFYQNLPHKPYCTDELDELGAGLIIRQKKTAIQMPYIQHNPPFMVNSLVFDIDRSDAFFSWSDANLAPPNWISKNPRNGHAHIGYLLATPVCRTYKGRESVLRYLASIEQAYTEALNADRGYVGLITKNPTHSKWETHILTEQPYELGYLADFVDLKALPKKPAESTGLGRNCTLFDIVRWWAYDAIRAFISGSYDGWHREVLNVAVNANCAFLEPLPYSEVKATAKSVSRWVWRNHGKAYAKFIERQAAKGRKGDSSHGGKARSSQYSDMRHQALKLHIQGKSIKEISEYLNVHRNSVSKWVKNPCTSAT